jgi:hypothetical protein
MSNKSDFAFGDKDNLIRLAAIDAILTMAIELMKTLEARGFALGDEITVLQDMLSRIGKLMKEQEHEGNR